ncbi:MAG: hexokinase [Oscillospiraceae bacterium]|jgi:hexokinase|nr:hexokinase [Oscillospiraceae bacterium]
MERIAAKTDDFMRRIGMHPEQTDIGETTRRCVSEMERGLRGENSSLTMIPTYISARGTPPDDVPVITVDAGGTNLRLALVTFRQGRPEISHLEVCPIPGSLHEVTADEFFGELADKLLPLTAFGDRIGFCFSYPAEIFPDRDGRILRFSKGVNVKDSAGLVIGKTLKARLAERGVTKALGFTLLNDTAAGMMGGAAEFSVSGFDGICGLILGTGFNTCYPEKGTEITKLKNAEDMIINCETGNFSCLFRGRADEMTDLSSENPGIGLCEKMISGAYLGKVITNTARLAAEEGLLSAGFAEARPFALPELDDFLRSVCNRVSGLCRGGDETVMRRIIDLSFARAAKLICVNIAALCLKCDGGKRAERPFCVVAEGSTFYKSLLLRDKLEVCVKEYIAGRLSRHIVFRGADKLTLTGAALSALIN